jgi:ferredoxin
MAYIITSPCIGEKASDCVDVCPVDCIAEVMTSFLSIQIFVLTVAPVKPFVPFKQSITKKMFPLKKQNIFKKQLNFIKHMKDKFNNQLRG